MSIKTRLKRLEETHKTDAVAIFVYPKSGETNEQAIIRAKSEQGIKYDKETIVVSIINP